MGNTAGLKPWKPGQCPNPNGRPKGPSLRTRLKKFDEKAFAALESALTSKSRLIQLNAFEVWASLRYRPGEDESLVQARPHVIVLKQVNGAASERHERRELADLLAISPSAVATGTGASSSLTSAYGASATLPQTPIREVKEEHFGTMVSDPYQWLEDTKNPEVVAWLKAQNDYTRSVLDALPERSSLLTRIHTLNDSGITVTGVQLEGGRVFYFKTSPGTNNRRLFVRSGFEGKEHLLVDPETLTAEGKHYSIDYFSASPDGKLVAYGISVGGSEDSVLQVMDVDTEKVFPERISRTQYAAVSWLPDNRSFFYLRFAQLPPDAPRVARYKKGQVYRHRTGADPETERPVFGYGTSRNANIGEDDFPRIAVIPGCASAFGIVVHGVKNERTIYAAPLKAKNAGVRDDQDRRRVQGLVRDERVSSREGQGAVPSGPAHLGNQRSARPGVAAGQDGRKWKRS